jgi:hypothetical protein
LLGSVESRAWAEARVCRARASPDAPSAADHPNHPALARHLHAYLRWRNANNRHPDVLEAQRRERARVRSEKGHHWGRPKNKTAA